LVEQLWVLLITGVLLATTVAAGARLFDAMTVRAAARDVADLFAVARDHAIAQGERTAVRIDGQAGRLVVYADTDTLSRLELRGTTAVAIEATRDSMAYSASGLGFGAANMRVVVRRGASADTITVSRLGRVRR
jgi:Tfp pilus assembly protein FimT